MNRPVLSTRRVLVTSLAFLTLLVLVCGGMAAYVLSDPGLEYAFRWVGVVARIEALYPDPVDARAAMAAATEAIFDRLDPYSNYLAPSRLRHISEELSGSYGGIGVTVTRHEEGLLMMSIRENGPAAEAGLVAGDVIVAVDSVPLESLTLEEASQLLRGKAGTKVLVSVFGDAPGDTLEVKLTRRLIPLMHIPYAGLLPEGVAYIRLLGFDAGATDDLESALDSLDIVSSSVRGLILDLRGNPGGLFEEAYRTASLFLDEGAMVVGTQGRSRWDKREFFADGGDRTNGTPMAILVDGGSASASEIVAGALRSAGRTVLVGDTTFGKGLVQGYFRLLDGDGLRLTVARYYFADGSYLGAVDSTSDQERSGLVPDVHTPGPRQDAFIRRLEGSLLLHQFVSLHQEDVTSDALAGELDVIWAEQFTFFARQEGFEYASSLTAAVRELAQAAEGTRSDALRAMLDGLAQRGEDRDVSRFELHSNYICRRLREIAVERSAGVYRVYRDVILPTSPEVALAVGILTDRTARDRTAPAAAADSVSE